MKMLDAAHAVGTIEEEAVHAGLDRGCLPGFWEWLSERKYQAQGGELTHEVMNDLLPKVPVFVAEFKRAMTRELTAWARRVEATDDLGL